MEELLKETNTRLDSDTFHVKIVYIRLNLLTFFQLKECNQILKRKLGPNVAEITKNIENNYLITITNLENEVKKLRNERETLELKIIELESKLNALRREKRAQ